MSNIVRVENTKPRLVMLPEILSPRDEKGHRPRPVHPAKRLMPGTNYVDPDYLKEVRKRDDVKRLFTDEGGLRVVTGGEPIVPEGSKQTLMSMSEEGATALLESCTDLMQLRQWLATEQRKSIVQALVVQVGRAEPKGGKSAA